MTYAIIGTGAIGGFYGGRLALSGQPVHFLFHTDYEAALAQGLRVDSCDGSFRLPHPLAYRDVRHMPPVDVVVVALKSVANASLLPTLLPPLLENRPLVLMIQNGIGIEPDLVSRFPEVEAAAGLAFICSAKVGSAHISHQCYGSINIGNYNVRDTARLARLLNDFRRAGIAAQEVEYHEARWKKAVWNMPFNGMTVALRTQTDRLLAQPHTRQLIRRQMLEVVGAAQALGVGGLDEAFADKMIDNTLRMTPYSPSMRLDYDHRRPMEIEYLYSRPIALARAAGFAMPCLEMLEAELRFIETERTD